MYKSRLYRKRNGLYDGSFIDLHKHMVSSTLPTLIFMGTPHFAVPTLKALVEAEYPIAAVYSQPPRPAGRGQKETATSVHQYALSQNLPVYTPITLKDPEIQHNFKALKANAVIVAAYGLLLPRPILEATPMGCINVHPSLLPRWRGAAPIQRTLMAGDTETGIVIMQMDAGLDTGDILMVKHFSIPEGMNAGELQDTLSVMAAPMVIETLKELKKGNLNPVPQPKEGVTYAHKITKEEYRIDWREPASSIYHKILGLSPHPGAYFIYKGEMIKILKAHEVASTSPALPGTTIDANLTVKCGAGALGLDLIQRPGKKPMPPADMLLGYRVAPGEIFG